MSELSSTTYVKQIGGSDVDPLTNPQYNVKYVPITYTMTGDEVAADTVNLFQLDPGSFLLEQDSAVYSEGVTATTCTITIGDGTTADKYSTALDVQLAGADAFTGYDATVERDGADAGDKVVFTFATLTGAVTTGKVLEFQMRIASPK